MQRDFEGAVEEYSNAIELAPRRPDLYIERGRQFQHLEDWEAAIESLCQGRRGRREQFSRWDALGWALFLSGDHLQALRISRRAAELDPQNGIVLAHLAMAYYARLNYESAAETMEKAFTFLDDDEINAQFTLTLGSIPYLQGSPQECERALPWLHKTLEFCAGIARCLSRPFAGVPPVRKIYQLLPVCAAREFSFVASWILRDTLLIPTVT